MSCKPPPIHRSKAKGKLVLCIRPGSIFMKTIPPNLLNLVLTFPTWCFVTFHGLFGHQIQICKCNSRTAVFCTPLPLGLFQEPLQSGAWEK